MYHQLEREKLSLFSVYYLEFTSSKFSHKIHSSNSACEYVVTRTVYLKQMHQSFNSVKTSRKDTLKIASYCGSNIQYSCGVSGIINTEVT